MKSLLSQETTTHEGILETRALTIASSGKAFREIVAGIYSNKTYAIARELIANAVDSHVENGNPNEQFEIHIPSPFEPYFSCRDYGVSMSHDMIMELYSVMFMSTKDDPNSDTSNNYTGKFGLGSKTPFAYTDAFQLTAYLDGEARLYDIFFDDGTPKIALFSKEPSDERTGILITFPVDPNDFVDFTTAIVRASEPLDIKPKFTGQDLELPERKIIHSGIGWRMLDELSTNTAQIKMGTVIYPLDSDALDGITSDVRTIIDGLKLQIDIPIGDVEVTTSRESLSYDARTVTNILNRLDEVIVEVKTILTKSVLEAETYWKACAEYSVMYNSIGNHLYAALVGQNFTFKGRKLRTSFKMRWADEIDLSGFGISYIGRSELCTGKKIVFRNRTRKWSSYDADISPLINLHIVLEDTTQKKRYSNARMDILRDEINNDHRSTNYYRSPEDDYAVLWIRYAGKLPYAYKKLLVKLGRPDAEFINLLDVEYVHTFNGGGSSVGPRDRYKIFDDYSSWISPKEDDDSAEGELAYYILLEGKEMTDDDYIGASKAMISALAHLVEKDIAEDGPVVGLNKSQRKRIRDNDMWIDLHALLKDKIVDAVSVEDAVNLRLQRDYSFGGNVREFAIPLIKMFNDVDMDGTIIGEVIDYYLEYEGGDGSMRFSNALEISETINRKTDDTKYAGVTDLVAESENKMSEFKKAVDKALPLTTLFSSDFESLTEDQEKDFVNYAVAKLLKSDS